MVEDYLRLLVTRTVWEDDEDGQVVQVVDFRSKGRPHGQDDAMNKRRVRRTIVLADLPPLTEVQKAELAALAAKPES
jgi:hypothetical protein